MSDAQLDRITAGTLNFIGTVLGSITVSAAITRPSATNLVFSANGNGNLTFSGATASLDANGGDVTITLNGAVTSGGADADIRADDVSITAGPGGIGSNSNPLILSATTLTTDTNDATDGNQFLSQVLSESDTVTIASGDLDAGTGTITLIDDTFFTTPTGSILSPAVIGSDAVLAGNGTTSTVSVQSSATVFPGTFTGTGILNTGDISFASGSTLEIEVNGSRLGSDYSQLNVTGTVSLGGATLLTSGTITSAPGQTIVLINNDGTDAVSGTFDGLADGAIVSINGVDFLLSYYGGNGNDVTLTQAGGSLTFSDDDGAADTFTIRRIGNTVQVLNGSTVLAGADRKSTRLNSSHG